MKDSFRLVHEPRKPFGARHGIVRPDTFNYFPKDSTRKGTHFSDVILEALREHRQKILCHDRVTALQHRLREIDF